MPLDWPALRNVIDRSHRFLVTCHVRPDGDALGSALGMAALLRALGKDARVVSPSPTPPRYDFLDPDQTRILQYGRTITDAELADRQTIIILDLSSWGQLGDFAPFVRAFPGDRVVIDHHVSQDDLGALVLKDTAAEATGTLILRAARALGVAPDADMATALFTAIAMDTGWFRHTNTTAETLRDAASLVESGADPSAIYQLLFERSSPARLRLIGTVLGNLALELDGRLAHASVSLADLERTGAIPPDTEDIIDQLASIDGVEVAALFIEQLKGGVKVSLRSRRGLDCATLAASLGGGGHRAAAGATLNEPLESGRLRALTAIEAAIRSAGK